MASSYYNNMNWQAHKINMSQLPFHFQKQHPKQIHPREYIQPSSKLLPSGSKQPKSFQNPSHPITYSVNINQIHPTAYSTPLQYNNTNPYLNMNIRSQQMTNQYIHNILNCNQLTNANIVKIFKGLDYEGRTKLEKYCIKEFSNQSLFLLYELSFELGLDQLRKICTDELINQNYQQLNYYKYDLAKCSYSVFRKILDQYKGLTSSLEIQGLRTSDLKSIIDDYCLMCSIDDKEKNNLYNQFVYVRDNPLAISNYKQTEVRRSMIETRKNDIEISTPLKVKNTINLSRTPNLGTISIEESTKTIPSTKSNNLLSKPPHPKQISKSEINFPSSLKESASLIKKQIQKFKEKQSQLYTQIVQTRKQVANNKNEKQIKEGFEKLEKSFKNIENQILIQSQRIQKLQKSASNIRGSDGGSKKIDFVFSF